MAGLAFLWGCSLTICADLHWSALQRKRCDEVLENVLMSVAGGVGHIYIYFFLFLNYIHVETEQWRQPDPLNFWWFCNTFLLAHGVPVIQAKCGPPWNVWCCLRHKRSNPLQTGKVGPSAKKTCVVGKKNDILNVCWHHPSKTNMVFIYAHFQALLLRGALTVVRQHVEFGVDWLQVRVVWTMRRTIAVQSPKQSGTHELVEMWNNQAKYPQMNTMCANDSLACQLIQRDLLFA